MGSRGVKMPPPPNAALFLGITLLKISESESCHTASLLALHHLILVGDKFNHPAMINHFLLWQHTRTPPAAHAQPSCIRIIQILAVLVRLDCSLGKGWQPSGWLTTNQFVFVPQTNWGSCWVLPVSAWEVSKPLRKDLMLHLCGYQRIYLSNIRPENMPEKTLPPAQRVGINWAIHFWHVKDMLQSVSRV